MTGLESRDAAAAAVAVKPRVTLDQIKGLIASERYFLDDTLTICVLTLTNGYKVTGESAAADPANFNEELGRKIAKEKAIAEIWPLAGYLLRDTLHKREHPPVMRCKVVLQHRQPGYNFAPCNVDGHPPGRYTEEPWTHDYGGRIGVKSGVTVIADPTDPANIVLDGENLSFYAVVPSPCDPNGSEENRIFGDATPMFALSAHVRNPAVLAALRQGGAYYVDFIPAG